MDQTRSADFATTQAEFRSDSIAVQLNHVHLSQPLDDLLRIGDGYRLDLSLTGRVGNPQVRYRDRWGPHRYEPVGALFLARDGEWLQGRSGPGSGSAVVCQLRPSAVRAWFDDDLDWTEPRLEACLDLRSPELKAILHRMAAEVRSPGFAHAIMLEALAIQTAVELRRYCTSIRADGGRGGLAPWRLRLIDDRLEAYPTAPTLDELAGLCGVSVRQLTRGFRVSRRCSIAEHVAANRTGRAQRMIAAGQNIKTVAFILGFNSASSFTFSFRAATGLTPGQYRDGLVTTVRPR